MGYIMICSRQQHFSTGPKLKAFKIFHSAFTLVELMVVISVIALLIALLLPALGSARVAAQRVGSMSNVRQISTSLFIYTNDFHESMPFQNALFQDASGINAYRWSPQWSRILVEKGYLSNMEIYWSAGRERYGGDWPHTQRTNTQLAHTYESVGYGLNRAVSPSDESDYVKNQLGIYDNSSKSKYTLGQEHLSPLRMGDPQAPRPSSMLLLMETYSSQGSLGGANGIYLLSPARYDSQGTYAPFNYGGAIVRSYVDGHASALAGSRAARVTGQKSFLDIYPNMSPTVPDELGFSVAAGEGPYGGLWTYQGATDYQTHTPWYLYWRTGWHESLR